MSTVRAFAKAVLQRVSRRLAPVDATALTRTKPVSRRFGMDRGQPIDRHYIEAFVRAHVPDITGDVLEIGEARYARTPGASPRRIDVLHATTDNPSATLVGDLTAPATLPSDAYDCVICTQTLGFIYDVNAAVRGLHQLLRGGGTALVTVAGISQISRYDMDRWGDYWRFTDASLRRLFEPVFGRVEVASHGNVATAVAFLQGLAIEDLGNPAVLDTNDRDYPLVLTVRATKAS